MLPGMTCMLQLALDDMGEKTMPSVVMMVPMKMNDFLIIFSFRVKMLQKCYKNSIIQPKMKNNAQNMVKKRERICEMVLFKLKTSWKASIIGLL